MPEHQDLRLLGSITSGQERKPAAAAGSKSRRKAMMTVTDRATRDYLEECQLPGSLLRDVVRQATFPQRYFECCGTRMMPRPFFIEEQEIRGSAHDLTGIFDLLVSLPARLFGGDITKYCEHLGIGNRQAALMQRIPTGRPTLFGRSDLYHDGASLRLLEFNLGSQLGGIDQAQVPPALLAVPSFRSFAQQHGLSYVHTGQQIARAIRAAAEPVTGGAEPVAALLEGNGYLAQYMPLMRSFEETLQGCGIDIRLGELGQVEEKGGKLFLDDTPIDVVLRYFSIDQILADPQGEEIVEPVLRAHELGGTILLTTLDAFLFSNKRCLTLLSDPQWRAALSADESALVDRFVPWTRNLVDGLTDVNGQAVDLIEYCRASRERLLLKPDNEYGGRGIVLGWDASDRDWKDALLSCRSRSYIVQERVVPRHEFVVDPDTGQTQDWVACWSIFMTPDGYAGSHIRALPAGNSRIISRCTNAATRLTGVFHY
jgi:hypothetical protein